MSKRQEQAMKRDREDEKGVEREREEIGGRGEGN